MKQFLVGLLLLIPSYSFAGTICSGSWDGEGKTTCELLGRMGETNIILNFSGYRFDSFLFGITARSQNQVLEQNLNGSLTFRNDYDTYNSWITPSQFAYWRNPDGSIIVGVEDLHNPINPGVLSDISDYDYNDYVVSYRPIPWDFHFPPVTYPTLECTSYLEDEMDCPQSSTSVPEGNVSFLLGIGFLLCIRKFLKG